MLRQFATIKNCGIFENFRWDSTVLPFERINLLYGTNGAGKTSLARILDTVDTEGEKFGDVSFRMSDQDHSHDRTSDHQHDEEFDRIFVFSDRYVSRSHNFSGDPEIEAVLTLGQKTVEDEARIADLKNLIQAGQDELTARSKVAKTSAKALDEAYTGVGRQVVLALQRAGGDYRSNGSYNQGVVKRRFANSHDSWKTLSEEDKKADLATVNSDNRDEVSVRASSFDVRPDLLVEAQALLASSPVSVMLDTLKDHEEATTWVEQGRHLHIGATQCIFCGGALTEARTAEIEQHFSDDVEQAQRTADTLIREVKSAQAGLDGLLVDKVVGAALFDDLRPSFNEAHAAAEAEVKILKKWLVEVLRALGKKRANVVAKSDYVVTQPPSVDGAAVEAVLKKHNERVAKHADLVQSAARRLEQHLLKESERKVADLVAAANAAVKEKTRVSEALDAHREEIVTLENVEGDPLPSAEVMSRELARILGRNELSFELLPDGKHYRVTRHGKPARDLSTGERTAITLIHFLEHVKHAGTQGGKPTVVIDDPVSSLDSGAAMGISTYIWSETVSKSHVGQIFLLTHSFELFRQWDIQIHGLPGGRGPGNRRQFTSNCYELVAPYKSVGGVLKRVPVFVVWPPNEDTRIKVRSAYHHAFIAAVRAYRALLEDGSMEKKLDAQLLYPNVLRRILEAFLAFKSPTSVGNFTAAMREMGEKLEECGYEGDADALRLQLTRFTHANSHSESPETDAVVNPDEIGPTIAAVFAFISVIDKEHFEGLCSVIGVEPSSILVEPVVAT